MNRSLTIPIKTAGAVLGLTSEVAAYAHVPTVLQVVNYGGKKQFVLASQLANLLKVDLPTLWATVDDIAAREQEAAPAKAAKEARDLAAAEKRRLELIDKRLANEPAVRAAERAAAKGAA